NVKAPYVSRRLTRHSRQQSGQCNTIRLRLPSQRTLHCCTWESAHTPCVHGKDCMILRASCFFESPLELEECGRGCEDGTGNVIRIVSHLVSEGYVYLFIFIRINDRQKLQIVAVGDTQLLARVIFHQFPKDLHHTNSGNNRLSGKVAIENGMRPIERDTTIDRFAGSIRFENFVKVVS